MGWSIRKYRSGEECELWKLFHNTVHAVNSQDYDHQQLAAWAPDEIDEEKWRERILAIDPFVCVNDGEIVGYADLQESGYIDHFYVHHHWQRKGVGASLMKTIESESRSLDISQLTSNVSITAKPFFESFGFQTTKEQQVGLGEVILTNFRMKRPLS